LVKKTTKRGGREGVLTGEQRVTDCGGSRLLRNGKEGLEGGGSGDEKKELVTQSKKPQHEELIATPSEKKNKEIVVIGEGSRGKQKPKSYRRNSCKIDKQRNLYRKRGDWEGNRKGLIES